MFLKTNPMKWFDNDNDGGGCGGGDNKEPKNNLIKIWLEVQNEFLHASDDLEGIADKCYWIVMRRETLELFQARRNQA